jgi:signal transduction histidine kinase
MARQPSFPNQSSDRRTEQLRKLTEISRALTYTTEIEEVLRLATDRAAEILEADRAILMLGEEDGDLRVHASHGVEEEVLEQFERSLDGSLTKQIRTLLGAAPPECFLGVPLVAHGRVTGLLAVVRPSGDPCSEEEEWLLSAVADQVAVALENARLYAIAVRERDERAAAGDADSAANEASGRALATLSHDLRSPLNAIDSYSELMEMEILGPITDRQREALGRIRLSGRHLLAVLENVLEMTRLSAGVVRVNADSIDVGTVVEEAAVMVRPSANAKDQSMSVAVDPPLVVVADPDRLRQILVNLVGNAVKYTGEGGSIRLSASRRERNGRQWGTITVQDTGSGISPEELNSIFRPYYRAPGSEVDAPEGAGLGLAISRELIRQMEGEIDVESELGSGSTFTIYLPVPPEPPNSQDPDTQS